VRWWAWRLSGTNPPPSVQCLCRDLILGASSIKDCCNGTACPACVTDVPDECNAGESESWAKCLPSPECAKRTLASPASEWSWALLLTQCQRQCPPTECPPVDAMDLACAAHDSCCIRNRLPPSLPSCYPEGNYCWCDCNLVADVRPSLLLLLSFLLMT
jgi:hypothetical protein